MQQRTTGASPFRRPSQLRDVEKPKRKDEPAVLARVGQMHVVVIGIDRYQHCGTLGNAVSDARGALSAFKALGFQPKAVLLDDDATAEALDRLVKKDLRSLGKEDSLVVFFAGHGYTEVIDYGDGSCRRVGHIVPVDGARKHEGSCVRLRTWLDELTHLPVRHILVILDSCQSGIALEPMMIWNASAAPPVGSPFEKRNQLRSRRVITSALDSEYASDRGPTPGHSLFTGYLIEALGGGASFGADYVTGTKIGIFVQEHVLAYSKARQTPVTGVLQLDNNGELVVPLNVKTELAGTMDPPLPPPPAKPRPPSLISDGSEKGPAGSVEHSRGESRTKLPLGPGPKGKGSGKGSRKGKHRIEARPIVPGGRPGWQPDELRPDAGRIDLDFAATLDRHSEQRRRGGLAMSLLSGEPRASLTSFATWSAQHGHLTLVTSATQPNEVIRELLSHTPWFRCLPAARSRLATAAQLPITAIDAAIDGRSGKERTAWIDDLAAGRSAVRVAGWLLSALRNPFDSIDLTNAPAQGEELLTALGALGCPIAICLHHEEPTEPWLRQAIAAAAALTTPLPACAIAVTAPTALADKLLAVRGGTAALSMARQGLVHLAAARLPRRALLSRQPAPPATSAAALEQRLCEALAKDPRTRGRFEHRVLAPIHERDRQIEVLLAARTPRLIVELDGWYHLRDPLAYRRARLKDLWLQRAGFFTLRFLAEDVERRLDAVIDEIARGLAGRRVKEFPF